jgi:hypothetical protein
MKAMLQILQRNPTFALIVTGIGFFLCAITVVFIAAILAVAFSH